MRLVDIMKFFTLFFLFMTLSSDLFAQTVQKDAESAGNWVNLVDMGNRSFYYHIPIIRPENGYRRMFERISFSETQSLDASHYRSLVSLTEFDCDGKRYRTLEVNLYSGPSGTGSLASQFTAIGDWHFPVPDSTDDFYSYAACKL